jgi:predicted RNA binding protein YcfA (HicA-like mRNA interferase family)
MPKLYSSHHVIRILMSAGFSVVSQKGSHKKFRKGPRVVIVPHPKTEIPMGTFQSFLGRADSKKQILRTVEAKN